MAPKKSAEPDPSQSNEYLLLGRAKNSLEMGIVGLPNVGKSLLFNVLTKVEVPSENYPFCTKEPNHARVAIPDKRFNWLCDLYKPEREVPTYLDITDIAGLVKGASDGLGLGNAFLSNIKAVDGIYHVVRIFPDIEVGHVEGEVDPIRDLEIIHHELAAKDDQIVTDRINDYERRARMGIDKTAKDNLESLRKIDEVLKSEKDFFGCEWNKNDIQVLNELQLLCAKPTVYLLNLSEEDYVRQRNKWLIKVSEWIKNRSPSASVIPFAAKLEEKLLAMESEDERNAYLKQLGETYGVESAPTSALDKIIKTGYKVLNLIHYFTCGKDEVRCWTIRKYTKAPDAAGVIHSDFKEFFICGEVMHYKDLKKFGDEAEVKAKGKVYTEGKEYIVEDGDIIFWKHNARKGKK